ncbi:MAG: HRDC domain-containing protein [Elusimicrobia bacterium]|nr:HRDC domain-containing protein [Elusimicrobiota bacterium]
MRKDWRAELDEGGKRLYDELRLWRGRRARREGMPPYLILSNRELDFWLKGIGLKKKPAAEPAKPEAKWFPAKPAVPRVAPPANGIPKRRSGRSGSALVPFPSLTGRDSPARRDDRAPLPDGPGQPARQVPVPLPAPQASRPRPSRPPSRKDRFSGRLESRPCSAATPQAGP